MKDFAQYDAVGLAELVRRKEVTPLELVEEVIDRIERVNPTLNGVTIKMYDHARELAQGDIGNGPLAGVPFLLKDFLAEYAGVEYSSSFPFLAGVRAGQGHGIGQEVQSGRVHHGRQDEPARVRHRSDDRAATSRSDTQPLGHHTDAGRFERRGRRNGGCGGGAGGARQRRGGIDSDSGGGVRDGRSQANARQEPPRPILRRAILPDSLPSTS